MKELRNCVKIFFFIKSLLTTVDLLTHRFILKNFGFSIFHIELTVRPNTFPHYMLSYRKHNLRLMTVFCSKISYKHTPHLVLFFVTVSFCEVIINQRAAVRCSGKSKISDCVDVTMPLLGQLQLDYKTAVVVFRTTHVPQTSMYLHFLFQCRNCYRKLHFS